jgi:hypothetical protein
LAVLSLPGLITADPAPLLMPTDHLVVIHRGQHVEEERVEPDRDVRSVVVDPIPSKPSPASGLASMRILPEPSVSLTPPVRSLAASDTARRSFETGRTRPHGASVASGITC